MSLQPDALPVDADDGRPSVVRNVAWNWGGMAAELLAGLVVAPYLVYRLGDSPYGLWIFIGSLTGYFGLLDLGVRGSVGRHLALYRAQRDANALNATLNSAVAVLTGMALLVLTISA